MTGPVAVGEVAPDFSSPNQHGSPVSAAALRGASALLVFYPYAFTGICTGELRQLQDMTAEFDARRVRVVAVSCDSIYSLRTFAEAEGLTFDLVSDHWPHGAIADAFGVFDAERGCAVRGSFALDADGVVRWSVVKEIGAARDMAAHLAAVG